MASRKNIETGNIVIAGPAPSQQFPPKLTVEFTGEAFQMQRIGGISRYLQELICHVNRDPRFRARVRMLCYCNQYLQEKSSELNLNAIYFKYADEHWFPKIAPRIDTVIGRLYRSQALIRHCGYYAPQTLQNFPGVRISTFYDMIHERLNWIPSVVEKKRKTYELSDHCIAISESTKVDMLKFYGGDDSKITVIPLASDLHLISPEMPRVPPARNSFLLWVGGRDRYKNFAGFVAAISHSLLPKRSDIQLVFTGRPLSQAELSALSSAGICRSRCKTYNASDAELAWLYRNALALLFLSSLEGFGLPPLEAMSCGCPVIASDVSSIPEVVGKAAAYVAPNDPVGIARVIDRIVEDDTFRQELSRAGQLQSKKFSWGRMAKETMDVYTNAILNRQ